MENVFISLNLMLNEEDEIFKMLEQEKISGCTLSSLEEVEDHKEEE